MRLLKIALFSALLAVPVASQEHDHSHHSGERLGTVDFPTSCAEPVQAQFKRGVALLHSFWYDEAERTFRQVAAADPRCGMAWWGVAMSNYHPLWAGPTPDEMKRGADAARKASRRGAKTARERAYIDAIAAFYKDAGSVDNTTRARAYEMEMERLVSRFPDDYEGRIFYALALAARGQFTPADKTYAYQKRSATILNELLALHPEHPGISHYLIHSFDYPALAHLAVGAAHAYAKIAPSSAHALHMPSHIFVRLGLWPETIQSNLVSAAAGKANVKTPGATSWDALHAYDYLAYAYLQRGEEAKVRTLIDEMRTVSALDINSFGGYYALAAVPVRHALERKDWAAASALSVEPAGLGWSEYPYAEALVFFGRAVGAARGGDPARARKDLERIEALRQQLIAKKVTYWAGQVEIQVLAAQAWIHRAEGNDKDALSMMRKAADMEDATEKHPVTPGAVVPAREMLGDLLLELSRPAEALGAYENSLTNSPNRLNGLTGAARAAQLAGNREKALAYYKRVAAIIDAQPVQSSMK